MGIHDLCSHYGRADEINSCSAMHRIRYFLFSVWILLVLPYFRALLLGVPDAFGEYARLAHFILPIYTLAGILSIRTLVRGELFRTMSPKQMILGMAAALILLGGISLLFLIPNTTSTTHNSCNQ